MSSPAVVIKHVVKDKQGREISHKFSDLQEYIDDASHDGEKMRECPVTGETMQGAVGFYAEDRAGQVAEAEDLISCYAGQGKPTRHVVISYDKGESLTLADVRDDVERLLKHIGMEGHKALYAVHQNTEHVHIHIALVRVAPEPNPKGKYYIPVDTGTVVSTSPENGKQRRNDALCMQSCISDICQRRGCEIPENCRTNADGTPRPVAGEKDRMSDGTRAGECRTGIKAKERQIAEFADRVFRDAKTAQEAVARLNDAGLAYKISYKKGVPVGAMLESHDGTRVKNSRLSRENSFRQLAERFPGLAGIKNNVATTPTIDIYRDQLTAHAAKKALRPILCDVKNGREGWDALAEKLPSGMTLEKSGGGYIVTFNDGADRLKLSQIGREFSASKLQAAFDAPARAPARAEARADARADYADRAEKSVQNAAGRAAQAGTDLASAQTLSAAIDEAIDAIGAAHALRQAQERAAKAETLAAEAQRKLDKINQLPATAPIAPVGPEKNKEKEMDNAHHVKKPKPTQTDDPFVILKRRQDEKAEQQRREDQQRQEQQRREAEAGEQQRAKPTPPDPIPAPEEKSTETKPKPRPVDQDKARDKARAEAQEKQKEQQRQRQRAADKARQKAKARHRGPRM